MPLVKRRTGTIKDDQRNLIGLFGVTITRSFAAEGRGSAFVESRSHRLKGTRRAGHQQAPCEPRAISRPATSGSASAGETLAYAILVSRTFTRSTTSPDCGETCDSNRLFGLELFK